MSCWSRTPRSAAIRLNAAASAASSSAPLLRAHAEFSSPVSPRDVLEIGQPTTQGPNTKTVGHPGPASSRHRREQHPPTDQLLPRRRGVAPMLPAIGPWPSIGFTWYSLSSSSRVTPRDAGRKSWAASNPRRSRGRTGPAVRPARLARSRNLDCRERLRVMGVEVLLQIKRRILASIAAPRSAATSRVKARCRCASGARLNQSSTAHRLHGRARPRCRRRR